MAFYLVYWFYRLSGTYKYADFEAMEAEGDWTARLKAVCAGEALPLACFCLWSLLS